MLQITGVRLSDYVVRNATTLGHVRDALTQKPKPKTIAQQLAVAGALSQQPNVKVSAKRVGMIDKHKEVGRWKLIANALVDRGLPVPGPKRRVKRAQDMDAEESTV